jgi:hypothetical protein
MRCCFMLLKNVKQLILTIILFQVVKRVGQIFSLIFNKLFALLKNNISLFALKANERAFIIMINKTRVLQHFINK